MKKISFLFFTFFSLLLAQAKASDLYGIENCRNLDSFILNTSTELRLPMADPQFNKLVAPYVEQYTKQDYLLAKHIFQKGRAIMPVIDQIFRAEGIPSELMYLAYIESNFNNHVVSPYGAKGMWQLIRPTAIYCGLQVNNKIDERTDPVKATHAAARLFKTTYKDFQDWLCVIAGFNCGSSAMQYYINRAGSSNFWKIYPLLPRQTKEYVAQFMGIVQVMSSIHDEYPEDEFWHIEKRGENASKPLIEFAATAEPISTPKPAPNEDTSPANKEEEIYEKEYFVYIVRKGDSLYKIAKRFPKNRLSNIRINNSLSSDILYPGMTILLEK